MDIWDAIRIILRRWFVALPIFLAFVGAAFVASGQVDAEYRVTADLILLGPHQSIPEGASIPPQQINAYLQPCNTCGTMANAIMLSLSGSTERDKLEADGWSTDYGIGTEQRNPIMHLEATSRDPDQAVGTIDVLIDEIAAELEGRQADVNAPEAQRITSAVLAQDAEPAANFKAATRVKLALAAVGLAAAAGAAFAVEGWFYYLEQRRRNAATPPGGNSSHVARHSRPGPDVMPPPQPGYRETAGTRGL